METESGSTAFVTDDRVAHPKRWYAALVQMNCEKKLAQFLHKSDIEYYLPVQNEIHRWSDRKKKVERIVIPMIVFVHVNDTSFKDILRLSYVYKILSYPGSSRPAVIPQQQIDVLKFMLNNAEAGVSFSQEKLLTGQDVEIIRGPLKGLKGKLTETPDNCHKLVVDIECIGYASVNVDRRDVIPVVL